jgi:CubicO group peptidase (beta-lactamase class C family)
MHPLFENPMRRLPTLAISLTALLAIASLAKQAPPRDNIASRINAIFSQLIHPAEPGASVAVIRDGTASFERGYGLRDLHSGEKINPQTNFRLASVTKQFTAMAIMLLVHDGKLHYDDHLTDIFPDFPAYGKSITIRNLLNHTGGLPDYEEVMEREAKHGGRTWSVENQIQDKEVLALLKSQPTGLFPPGTRWQYSNSGYVLLGLIVAKVSGMPYRDFLQQRVFTPLRMTNTLVYQKGKNTVSRRAYGHSNETGKLIQADQSSTSATLGDGGIYSNVVDLAKWDEGLRNHTLLSEMEMQPALTPVKLADGSEPHWPHDSQLAGVAEEPVVRYGFGWFLDPYQGHTRSYHDGSTEGFRTAIQRFVGDHFTVIVLCNRTDLNASALSLKIADLLLQPSNP